jgi:hypothetical protein
MSTLGLDPYQKAAHLALDGDFQGAWEALFAQVKSKAKSAFEPEFEADEIGLYTEYKRPAKKAVADAVQLTSEYVSDAAFEILQNEQGMSVDDATQRSNELAEEIQKAWVSYQETLVDELVLDAQDDAEYDRNPHRYFGVSRSDF